LNTFQEAAVTSRYGSGPLLSLGSDCGCSVLARRLYACTAGVGEHGHADRQRPGGMDTVVLRKPYCSTWAVAANTVSTTSTFIAPRIGERREARPA
jgi:hypothetical protein